MYTLIDINFSCIGYTSNYWCTNEIPLDQYQEKLQEKRREWGASQPVQSVHHQNERKEIEQLRCTLQEREKELQEERREKEQVRTRLQQQLQEKDRQITDKDQRLTETQRCLQSREREYQEREQQLQRQLQDEQQQGQDREGQFQERERQFQERERQLWEAAKEKEQNLQQQLQQSQQQLQEREQQFQERERQFQERKTHHQEETESSWVVNREGITTTKVVLGKGGWGEVKVAHFCGLKVAAKCLHEVIISPYNMSAFSREINIASKIRHPNILQFIGATTEGNPIILTELMSSSLRKELDY